MSQSKLVSILLDHRLFMVIVALIGVLSVGLLVYGGCRGQQTDPTVKAEDIVLYPMDRGTVEFPLEINIVDGDFNESQFATLQKAATTWSQATKGLVNIKLNKNYNPPMLFSSSNYENFGKKTMWKRSGATDNEVVKLQLKYSICADAVSVGDFIMILDDFNNLSNDKLYIVALHEWGHQLGLEHVKPQYPALMNIGGNNGEITKYDNLCLCSLYKCN